MRTAQLFSAYSLLLIVFVFNTSVAQTNRFELRHKFAPGQKAQAVTRVNMQGKTLLLGENADTRLKMNMFKEYQVRQVDSFGNASVDMTVKRIQTQGKWNGTPINQDQRMNQGTQSEFDETLEGQPLNQLLMGASQMSLQISPKGHVSGGQGGSTGGLDAFSGLSLPNNIGTTGGFEFPTFPNQAVSIGAYWDQSGSLVNSRQVNQRTQDGWVYNLYKIRNSSQGRVATIRYKKVTDLSGLSLGDDLLSGSGLSSLGGASAQVGGLVIELEGEIEFNIDHGLVVQSTQMGTWNLQMQTNSKDQREPANIKQDGMQIRIQTQFQWNKVRQPQDTPTPNPQRPPEVFPNGPPPSGPETP